MKKFYSNFSKANKLLEGNVSIFLDLVRGISAILVVMEHLSSRLFVGYGNLENPNLLVKFLYLLNFLGNPAVIIFFVLSGLFISRSVLIAVFENIWSWKSYLINRFSRLFIVLIPALILTFILDSFASNFLGYESYDNSFSNLKEFIGNLLFLQGVFVGFYGSNAPLWSLSYEFWYYMLFPLLIGLFINKTKINKFIYFLFSCIIISTIGIQINSYFVIWLIGPFILLLPRIKLLIQRFFPVLSLILVLVAMTIHPLVMTGRLFSDKEYKDLMSLFGVNLFVGLAFGLLVYTLLHSIPARIREVDLRWLGKISKLFAGFSFSLYLIHYPIINTVYYWYAKNGFSGLQPNLISILAEILIVILICFIAFLFSRITETQTHFIRNFLTTKTDAIFARHSDKVQNRENKVI
ncbi:peptidoglycan/LPS O-acetylase OafA/YrhL [Neobacillus niacini]|uniref:acyltransferase family protein n=1 Tax=Neobacillus niacini TaxID=86668 RepID=UPI0028621C37|nr:acyltransferase [Neobacillus niacini]MDR7079140.1 peptidoglycan/LPS O-acetylase OafA/YrhL [Neobacillus niacini]